MNALEVRGLCKAFGGLKVVTDLSFAVGGGERVALIGPNGAGKTTAFNLISGAYAADSGGVWLQGRDITRMPSSHRAGAGLARSFQNIRLMPRLTTLENLMLGQQSRANGVLEMLRPIRLTQRGEWAEEAREALAASGLAPYADMPVVGLPYGIRKRIEVVRALLARPTVLLLDEPCAGLNTRERADMTAFLLGLEDRGISLVIVEHDMPFIAGVCHHAIVLNFGVKIAEGTPAEIAKDPAVLEAYLGQEEAA